MFTVASLFSPQALSFDANHWRSYISSQYCVDENAYVAELIEQTPADDAELTLKAQQLASQVRNTAGKENAMAAFLQQYSLNTQEGIILMSLAEALLRIPDRKTQDALIKDKLSAADWAKHIKQSDSTLVNASTWGLMLTGKVLQLDERLDGQIDEHPASLLQRMLNRLGEPLVRAGILAAMKIMGRQFVLGRTIKEALKASRPHRALGYCHSYDMLGEAAITAADAEHYYQAYAQAISEIGKAALNNDAVPRPSISIKLSALHPRYQEANRSRVLDELFDTVLKLLIQARKLEVAVTIDAEEMDRLELSLDLFEKLYRHPENLGWGGLGLVVQAYAKRALVVLAWLAALAREQGEVIPLRLVKGAYWDSEIKHSQQAGLTGYPVFSRKAGTDISYLVCARFLLSEACQGALYPQFATHNAQTVLAIQAMAGDAKVSHFEFQRLHGMADDLYNQLLKEQPELNCRIYAPVGAHRDLLPYLVRRLLENGANSSFVHQLLDANTPIETLIEHPLATLEKHAELANSQIPLPLAIFSDRANSQGLNLNIAATRAPFMKQLAHLAGQQWQAHSLIAAPTAEAAPLTERLSSMQQVLSPQNSRQVVGQVAMATPDLATLAVTNAQAAFVAWRNKPVEDRAQMLERLGNLLEEHKAELISLCTREAGKLLQDGIDEVREAVDFCRYYARQARDLLAPQTLPGYTGESNTLQTQGRGVFICISPWNFPLAIFIGQVSAALVTGNTVIAKPAPQTCLIAHLATQLAYEAGIPNAVLQLVLGEGELGQALIADSRISGVCFTGSTATAQQINRTLAERSGAIIPLIAETGGQNAMIVDSSALPEQVVNDVIRAAFQSAGQRCSALRVLYLQSDISERVLELLAGAMIELSVGDPALYSTDVGPVIDAQAYAKLEEHLQQMQAAGKSIVAQTPLPDNTKHGHYIAPTALLIEGINELSKEHFGPILHVVIFKAEHIDAVIDDINAAGYGLTLGIHSRNQAFAQHIASRANVGNIYINRDQIGAMVGVQPFGGQGLSGTGPKAGGPHYLTRFITEKTITNNTTAIGGNASLLAMGEG